MMWVLEYSESFANGQIDGYFDMIPDEFWYVFKMYTALYALEHLSYNNGENIDKRIFNASRMLNLFGKTFSEDIPLFRTVAKRHRFCASESNFNLPAIR